MLGKVVAETLIVQTVVVYETLLARLTPEKNFLDLCIQMVTVKGSSSFVVVLRRHEHALKTLLMSDMFCGESVQDFNNTFGAAVMAREPNTDEVLLMSRERHVGRVAAPWFSLTKLTRDFDSAIDATLN